MQEKDRDILQKQEISTDPDDERDRARFAQLQRELSQIGLFRRGTLQERHTKCARPRCRCRAEPPQLHGPLYHWTRKVKAKTVSAYLTAEQAEKTREWIANARRLDEILEEMQELSLRLTERLLPPRPPRKAGRRPGATPAATLG